MSARGEMSSFESAVAEMFRRMGLPDPEVMARIMEEWDAVAGEPWAGRSRPVAIAGKTLTVEASTPSLVAFLRYAVSDLIDSLNSLIGEGIIEHVEVRPPTRN